MTKNCDAELGSKVSRHLAKLGIETPILGVRETSPAPMIENAFATIMDALLLDLKNDSLSETPKRVAKMFTCEIFYGLSYFNFPKCTVIENTMKIDEVVCVKNINVKSMCEHHFVPFIGTANIAYIPKDKIIGLSKFNRVVDFFARRPQVQERLTVQIHAALCFILGTNDVAVTIEAEHLCVKLRGVKDDNSSTATSKVSGRFMSKPALRNEFFNLSK